MNWFKDRFNDFRLIGSQDNNSLEQEIEQRAYELWEEAGRQEGTFDDYYKKAQLEQEIKPTAYFLWEEAGKPKGKFQKYLQQAEIEIEIKLMTYLLWKKDGQPEDKFDYYEDYYYEKAKQKVKLKRLPIIYKPFYFFVGQPYYFLEKKILEPGLAWTDKQAFFDILEKVGQLTIILGVISFIFTEDSRRNAEVFSAWQTITSADEKQAGSGGRIEALEFLHSRPLRFPFIGFTKEYWYWDGKQCEKKLRLGYRFPRQNLSGLSAPNAYLAEIKLCGALLEKANLQGTNLKRAELQRVFMSIADLQNSYLLQANLQGAYLRESNLEGAWLMGANLYKAYLGGANLMNTNLEGSNLKLANFRGANLLGANLQTNTLGEVDNFEGAIYGNSETNPSFCPIKHNNYNNCSTIFPDGFDPNKAGMYLIITPEDYEEWKKYRENVFLKK